MGYSTKFEGRFEIKPALTMDHFAELKGLAGGDAEEGPGGYCQWTPTDDGKGLEWDRGEKFYKYVEWLEYLVKKLAGWKRRVSGSVTWKGEDRDDRGTLSVVSGKVIATKEGILPDGAPLDVAREAFKRIVAALCDGHDDHAVELAKAALERLK